MRKKKNNNPNQKPPPAGIRVNRKDYILKWDWGGVETDLWPMEWMREIMLRCILWHWKSPQHWVLEAGQISQKEDYCHCLSCCSVLNSAAGHLWKRTLNQAKQILGMIHDNHSNTTYCHITSSPVLNYQTPRYVYVNHFSVLWNITSIDLRGLLYDQMLQKDLLYMSRPVNSKCG